LDDSGANPANPVIIDRTGLVIDSITLAATQVTLNCSGLAANSIDITPTAGNFTAELADASSGGNVLATGTAYWKKIGGIVTIQLRALLATTTATTFYVRNIPAELQPALTGTNSQCIAVSGLINGSSGVLSLKIPEGVAYWFITPIGTTFTAGSAAKGLGENTAAGVTITYMVSD
jgi:hypothetical protein